MAGTTRARIALTVYSVCVVGLFGVSALYHRVSWRTLTGRDWMRRLDHSMIFVMIAGSYTPFALLVLHGPVAVALLIAVWAGALLGVVFNLVWRSTPTWLRAALYVGLGWIAVAALPQLGPAIGTWGVTLLGLGGVLYTVGAVVYAGRRPDPVPAVFGYHEALPHSRDRRRRPSVRGYRVLDRARVSKAYCAPGARRSRPLGATATGLRSGPERRRLLVDPRQVNQLVAA